MSLFWRFVYAQVVLFLVNRYDGLPAKFMLACAYQPTLIALASFSILHVFKMRALPKVFPFVVLGVAVYVVYMLRRESSSHYCVSYSVSLNTLTANLYVDNPADINASGFATSLS